MVGALVQPCERRADDEGEARSADGELDRVPEEPRGLGAAVRLGVVAERELRRLVGGLGREEALPDEEAQRDERDVDRDRNAQGDDDPAPLEAAPLAGCAPAENGCSFM